MPTAYRQLCSVSAIACCDNLWGGGGIRSSRLGEDWFSVKLVGCSVSAIACCDNPKTRLNPN